MARKDWKYCDSRNASHGLMKCYQCGKPIVGQYRVRDVGEQYVTMHRTCSEDDPKWALIDGERGKNRQHHAEFLKAAIAFRDRWQVSELDDLIESMEQS